MSDIQYVKQVPVGSHIEILRKDNSRGKYTVTHHQDAARSVRAIDRNTGKVVHLWPVNRCRVLSKV